MIDEALLDMDGVLVNFIEGALKLYNVEVDPYTLPENLGDWHINRMLGMDYKSFMAPMTVEYWRDLNWMPDGPDILAAIERKFGKENICLLSNPSASSKAMEGKMLWIERHLPSYRDRFLFGPSKQFAGGHERILIDDGDINQKQYKHRKTQKPFPFILIPRPWNTLCGIQSPLRYLEQCLETL